MNGGAGGGFGEQREQERLDNVVLPDDLVAAIDAVEQRYFGDYDALRKTIIAAGSTGDYAIESKTYFEQATVAIDTIRALAAQMGQFRRGVIEDAAIRAQRDPLNTETLGQQSRDLGPGNLDDF